MMLRNAVFAAAAVSLISLTACAGEEEAADAGGVTATPEEIAQADAALAADPPTRAELEGASRTFGFISALMRSEEVPVEIKNVIFGCLYENPLGELARDLESEKQRLEIPAEDADRSMQVLAQMCGFERPEQAE